jgi:hypothetical protein
VRRDLLAGLVPLGEYTAAEAAEQERHLAEDAFLYEPGKPRLVCSILGAVAEECSPKTRELVLEAVWMARRMDAALRQQDVAWRAEPMARTAHDVLKDIAALTPEQQTNVFKDLFTGNPPKWQRSSGTYAPAMFAAAASVAKDNAPSIHRAIAAMYCCDNPGYLSKPQFDPSIDVRS